jgi:protein phosphatase
VPGTEHGYKVRIRPEFPVLIVLCGPSHAGKTTFARKLRDSFVVINPDKIRKRLCVDFGDPEREAEVWGIYESMKCEALKEGRNVVLDACHISKRARWHSLQGPNAHHRKICVVFDLPLRTIRERCLK